MLPHCFMPWLTQECRLNSFWCLTVMSTSSQARCLIISYLSQELSISWYKIASRGVGCLCENDLICSCYNTNIFQLPTQEHTHQSATEVDAESNTPPENLHKDWNKLHPISGPAPGITGKWCAILHEGCIYPGIIQQRNSNQVEVQAMMKVGENRYKWPIKDDILWYDYDEVVSLIPAPKPVTKRHIPIEPTLWSMIVDVVDRSQ